MFMRYYGGGVGHVDPRRIEVDVDLVEDEDEGLRPDHGYDDAEESENADDDDSDDQSDPGESSDEEAVNVY
jgi:hypothetical protein